MRPLSASRPRCNQHGHRPQSRRSQSRRPRCKRDRLRGTTPTALCAPSLRQARMRRCQPPLSPPPPEPLHPAPRLPPPPSWPPPLPPEPLWQREGRRVVTRLRLSRRATCGGLIRPSRQPNPERAGRAFSGDAIAEGLIEKRRAGQSCLGRLVPPVEATLKCLSQKERRFRNSTPKQSASVRRCYNTSFSLSLHSWVRELVCL
jgi:hypothetical protein